MFPEHSTVISWWKYDLELSDSVLHMAWPTERPCPLNIAFKQEIDQISVRKNDFQNVCAEHLPDGHVPVRQAAEYFYPYG